jgi:hypothetical protein
MRRAAVALLRSEPGAIEDGVIPEGSFALEKNKSW